MKITKKFIEKILKDTYGDEYQKIFDAAPLIQYLDKKMGAVDRGCSTRRSLANLYAIYSVTQRYAKDYYENKEAYLSFDGYPYSELKAFCNSLYSGEKLQNHGYNNRAIGEFRNKTKTVADLFVINGGKYKIFPDYMYAGDSDISKTVNVIVEKFIELIKTKDEDTIEIIESISKEGNLENKKKALKKS